MTALAMMNQLKTLLSDYAWENSEFKEKHKREEVEVDFTYFFDEILLEEDEQHLIDLDCEVEMIVYIPPFTQDELTAKVYITPEELTKLLNSIDENGL